MQCWQELLKTALIGVDRQALNLTLPPGALGTVLIQANTTDPTRTALATAAVLGLWRQAGYNAGSDRQPLPPACAPESLPCCSPLAGHHLALMLQQQHQAVLPEWLRALAAAGRCVPPETLPELLELGAKSPSLRPLLEPVIGHRGRWLAQQNPTWCYAIAHTDDSAWQTGDRQERLRYLQRLRALDPAAALAALAAIWQQEAARERALFLAALTDNLSMADEPFLEQALDDRSKDVRQTAADLLASLPESRWTKRMTARAEPLLTLTKPALGKPRLEVTLPDSDDAALVRDAVTSKPLKARDTGERAWRLRQLIAAVPPALWTQRWQKTPPEIIQIAQRSDWKTVLLESWTLAARRHRDADWLEALLPFASASGALSEDWLAALPAARLERYICQSLDADAPKIAEPVLALLQHNPHDWSMDLGRTLLACLRQRVVLHRPANWHLRTVFGQFGCRMPAALATEAATGWPEDAPYWSQWAGTVREFVALLQFRSEMLVALQD